MNELHYEEDVIIDYLVASEGSPEREEIEEHLVSCPSCRETADSYLEFAQSLSDATVWEREEFTSAVSRADETKVRSFVDYAGKLQDEQNAAVEQITTLLGFEQELRKPYIDMSPDLWTAGFLQELCEFVHGLLDRSPAEASSIADLAIHVGSLIPENSYAANTIHHLRGRAWKEKSQALWRIDRHAEALTALDRAEENLAKSSASAFDLATTAYVRALIFRDVDRLAEALSLVQGAIKAFEQFGSQKRVIHSRNLEGMIVYKIGDLKKAREIWNSLLMPVQRDRDLPALATIFNNLGNVSLELGDTDSAGSYLLQAISVFDDLGMRTEALRARWSIGRMMITSGRLDESIRRLRQIQEEFESLEMIQEAGLAALDVVEVLLRKNETEEATVICRYLVERFANAGMDSNAITALSYLREALAAGKANPKMAIQVRAYVEEIPRRRRPQLFAPHYPPPLPAF